MQHNSVSVDLLRIVQELLLERESHPEGVRGGIGGIKSTSQQHRYSFSVSTNFACQVKFLDRSIASISKPDLQTP